MNGDGGQWIFSLIYLLIIVVAWIIRQSKRKTKTPAEPKAESRPAMPAAPELPPEAQRLLARAAASGHLPSSAVPHPNPFARDHVRESIYNELNLKDTEYLLQNWYEDDPEQWSDAAFEVMERILIERLGELPARGDEEEEAHEGPAPEPDEDVDPQVKELWAEGDLEGLAHVLRYDPDWIVRMDAAEALAVLGDPRGRDHLMAALEDPADDVRAVAREILDSLPAAPGNPRVQPREPEPQPESIAAPIRAGMEPAAQNLATSASPSDTWAAYRQKQAAFESEQMARAPGSREGGLPSMESITVSSAGGSRTMLFKPYLLVGAAGGALGFFGSYLLMYFAGAQLAPSLRGLQFIIQQVGLWLVPLDLAVGAASGAIGNLFVQGLAGRLGYESVESDATPMVGAGLGGLIGAVAVNAILLAISSM